MNNGFSKQLITLTNYIFYKLFSRQTQIIRNWKKIVYEVRLLNIYPT